MLHSTESLLLVLFESKSLLWLCYSILVCLPSLLSSGGTCAQSFIKNDGPSCNDIPLNNITQQTEAVYKQFHRKIGACCVFMSCLNDFLQWLPQKHDAHTRLHIDSVYIWNNEMHWTTNQIHFDCHSWCAVCHAQTNDTAHWWWWWWWSCARIWGQNTWSRWINACLNGSMRYAVFVFRCHHY